MSQCLTPFYCNIVTGSYKKPVILNNRVVGEYSQPTAATSQYSFHINSNSCKCEHCKVNKRNAWAFRIYQHNKLSWNFKTFLTLTYKDSDLLIFDSNHYKKKYNYKNRLDYAILCPGHWTDFINYFQKICKKKCGLLADFYAIAEYGAIEHRPHFHAIFFSPLCEKDSKDLIRESWDLISKDSIIDYQEITFADITYCAKHQLKDTQGNKFQMELCKPFQRMSRRNGGIGFKFLLDNIESLSNSQNKGVFLNNFHISTPYYYTKKIHAYKTIVNEFDKDVIRIIRKYNLLPLLLRFPELQKASTEDIQNLVFSQQVKDAAIVNEYKKLNNNQYFTYDDYLKMQREVNRELIKKSKEKKRSKFILKLKQNASKRKYCNYKKIASIDL